MAGSAIAIGAAFGIWYWSLPSDDQLPGKLQTSMNEYIQGEKQLRETGIKVTSVTVMHGAGNFYQGDATVADGTVDHEVPVHVAYDGDNLLWNTDPGAFLFALTHADP
jgi:hypothetical protein